MSGIVWLISESKQDSKIIAHLFKLKFPKIHIRHLELSKGSEGITKLDKELLDRVTLARKSIVPRPFNPKKDCIVVVHDDDKMVEASTKVYESLKQKCEQEGLIEIIARDELEAWLLSDSKLCDWLDIKREAWNGKKRPSETLAKHLDDKKRLVYPRDCEKILPHLKGDGTNKSFQEALKRLETLPCVSV